MKIGIISGSHRADSQSAKIAGWIERSLSDRGLCDETWLYSLAGNPLPFWDEGVFEGTEAWEAIMGPLRDALNSCDAFVIVAPEWHGMAPAGLKNFFLLWPGSGELAHKPALLVSVSASQNGAYPIAELRMSSYKNSRICYLPEHMIVRKAAQCFNADPAENDPEHHEYLAGRMGYCLEMLREYGLAFQQIRASGKVSLENYPNGM
jgi:NAD(P)H-dependent FMN reductase